MIVQVELFDGPLGPARHVAATGAGALVAFDGVVRPGEGDRCITALHYEAYEPMTSRELHRLATQFADDHRLMAIRVEHSVGRVPVGEASFRLAIASERRVAALAATGAFIDEMKRHVPLWKTPEFADE